MTREQAKQLLPIIQAFSEGKTVQCLSEVVCNTFDKPNDKLSFEQMDYGNKYRIKPEPREFWLNVYQHDVTIYNNKFEADNARDTSMKCELIHVKEVID